MSESSLITDIINSYVPLVQKGGVFTGYCPFCNSDGEKFVVRSSLNEWHCFNCGLGGDVYRFIQEYEGVSAAEAKKLVGSMLKAEEEGRALNLEDADEDFSSYFERFHNLDSYTGAAIINAADEMVGADKDRHVEVPFTELGGPMRSLCDLADGILGKLGIRSEVSGVDADDYEVNLTAGERAVLFTTLPRGKRRYYGFVCLKNSRELAMARMFAKSLRKK